MIKLPPIKYSVREPSSLQKERVMTLQSTRQLSSVLRELKSPTKDTHTNIRLSTQTSQSYKGKKRVSPQTSSLAIKSPTKMIQIDLKKYVEERQMLAKGFKNVQFKNVQFHEQKAVHKVMPDLDLDTWRPQRKITKSLIYQKITDKKRVIRRSILKIQKEEQQSDATIQWLNSKMNIKAPLIANPQIKKYDDLSLSQILEKKCDNYNFGRQRSGLISRQQRSQAW